MMPLQRLTLSPVVEDQLKKPPRLPRWTRQELLLLIQGKRVAENRVRHSSGHLLVDPKWSSVSSYCKRHGVNRGPVQCRKRWSNLVGDFKKIKEWESSSESESFWVMRNDLRREMKLPGFFDRQVYDILLDDDGTTNTAAGLILLSEPQPEPDTEVVFVCGSADNGLFSDEQLPMATSDKDAPISEDKETSNPSLEIDQGRKRKRPDATNEEDEQTCLQNKLIEAVERNGRLLNSHLEIQNTNSQLEREQRKDHANTLFAVLDKLADAMLKIADKL